MNTRISAAAIVLATAMRLFAADAHHAIASKNSSAQMPVWIPAAEAVTNDGELDSRRLPARSWQRAVERNAAKHRGDSAPAPECIGMTVFVDGGRGRIPPSLDALARESKTIVAGVVTDVVPGFFNGLPASLLRLSVTTALRNGDRPVFVVYPVARFTAGGRLFCRENNLYSETIPAVGDNLFLFGNTTVDVDDEVFAPLPYELFVERRNGQLIVPSDLAREKALQGVSTLARVTSVVRGAMERETP